MNRFGVPLAPNGCGTNPHEGPCFNCSVRALRRRTLWWIRQLLPLKYATHYGTGGGDDGQVTRQFVNVDYWRMWFGRVLCHKHYQYQVTEWHSTTSPS